MSRPWLRATLLATSLAMLSACERPPGWQNTLALQIGAPPPNAAEIRAAQTTQVTAPEQPLLVEATQVLQDLGFTVEESAPQIGVLAGSKDRDATEAGQVAVQVAATVALALIGVRYQPVWDTDQVIRTTLTTQPRGPRDSALRVSFERIVTNNQGASRVEILTGPEYSAGFFEKIRSGLASGG
ncbi:hypothetical protein [Paracraurococcus lichenis]|uniref:Penicillin-binding protein activator LpoB n=1 Tax=Paracraurococcus lichenis TaxID=3064888 RepID=A0ABT9DX90_9PROT|nr:hypothetical protein [Paracraurococcus sp. LOR1-02]MDO9708517.1 hypothetical protein [Paracraurococcus sp. LOR1-02]